MKAAAALLSALFVVSCASSPPRQPPPLNVSVPGQWAAGNTAESMPPAEWWLSFECEFLHALITEALAFNHDLKAAAARLEAAEAQARIAGAELSPRAGLGLDARRQQQNFIGLPIPGAEGGVLTARSTSYGLNLNTSWELDLWGRIRSGRRAALADLEASSADLAAARQSIAARAAKAWLAHAEARQQAALARSIVANHQATAGQVRLRYQHGVRSPLDLRLARASLASSQAALADREAQAERTLRQLEIILGRYPSGTLPASTNFPRVTTHAPAGLPSELLERRPDLIAAERRVAASAMRTRQSKLALLPRISLTASGGTASTQLSDLLDSSFSVWNIAGNLAQPLFEGGRLRAGIDLSSARTREAAEQYAAAALQAFSEVETALAVEAWLATRETELETAAYEASAALNLAEDRYRAGIEPFVTVLESQRRAWESESQLLAVRRQRADARIDLHLALAGDFGAPMPGN